VNEEPGNVATTAESNRSKVVAGARVTLHGQVTDDSTCTGPHEISILARIHGRDSFEEVARVRAAEDGTWRHKLRIKRSSSFTATPRNSGECETRTSAPTDVLVKVKITARVPKVCRQTATVRGRIAPNHRRSKVTLERKRKGGWKVVDRDRLNHRSRFKLTLPVCRGRFRVEWPAQDPSNLANVHRFRL
jgi:hypothetical protein